MFDGLHLWPSFRYPTNCIYCSYLGVAHGHVLLLMDVVLLLLTFLDACCLWSKPFALVVTSRVPLIPLKQAIITLLVWQTHLRQLPVVVENLLRNCWNQNYLRNYLQPDMVVLKICQAQANLYAASGTNFSVHHYLQLSMGPRSSRDFCFWKFWNSAN